MNRRSFFKNSTTVILAAFIPAKVLAKVKGGSLIIEEISDFSLESQARLVQMIDSPGEYSPRFIASMQGSMIEAVESGSMTKAIRDLVLSSGLPSRAFWTCS